MGVVSLSACLHAPLGPPACGGRQGGRWSVVGGRWSVVGGRRVEAHTDRHRPGQCNVGYIRIVGRLEYDRVVAWVEQGQHRAGQRLGRAACHRHLGLWVERVPIIAPPLRGDGLSMRALADGFDHGVGVGRDPALASYWRERADRAPVAQPARWLRP